MGRGFLVLAGLLLSASSLFAQGREGYMNVESPQGRPITVAHFDKHDYILVCNTPDNSVEIWDTNELLSPPNRFVKRVRVGLEPVSVIWHSTGENTGTFYTADFLGDSVTAVNLVYSDPNLTATVHATVAVGDEPVGLAMQTVFGGANVLYVTLSGSNAIAALNPSSLTQAYPGSIRIDPVDNVSSPTIALKEPRSVVATSTRVYFMGFKGGGPAGNIASSMPYDFDLLVWNEQNQPITTIGGVGTTNYGMALAPNGGIFSVGGTAQFNELDEEFEVRTAPNGFVKSEFSFIVDPEAPPPVDIRTRDVNKDSSGNIVPPTQALAQPTDLVVYEASGQPLKVFFTAFGSDRVGVIEPTGPNEDTWPLRRIEITQTAPNIGVAGPRGIALKSANPGWEDDPGARIYVLNRIANSISVINPTTETHLEQFPLTGQPEPSYIREGRRFLYDAKLSGNGFGSCASCHTDGRTDGLLWRLKSDAPPSPEFRLEFASDLPLRPEFAQALNLLLQYGFPAQKPGLVTQSLQGLLNFEVNPDSTLFFSNQPYHWRGDRPDFESFQAGFTGLLGRSGPIPDADMVKFRDFINSIHYPPNPQQPPNRRFSGQMGAIAEINDITVGSDAQRGMKVFHLKPLVGCGQQSCVHCHALGEGSNNRATIFSDNPPAPLESAALRGHFQKERRLDRSGSSEAGPLIGNFGMSHNGESESINGFVLDAFAPLTVPERHDVSAFVHELDWGVAPIVGFTMTVTKDTKIGVLTGTNLNLMEGQASLANAGLAVRAFLNGVERGFWMDWNGSTPEYREEGAGGAFSRGALLALCNALPDRLIFISTPLGSERRIASVTGITSPLSGMPPSQVTLQPMVPNTAYENVPRLTANWKQGNFPDFHWGGFGYDPTFPKSLRLFQHALVNYGVSNLRHEAPRRLVVAGYNIRRGAKLHIYIPYSTSAPDTSVPPAPGFPGMRLIKLPLYPTSVVLSGGRRVFQTAAELDPLSAYMIMCGGPFGLNVTQALFDLYDTYSEDPLDLPDYPVLDPANWNHQWVRIENEQGGQLIDMGWQSLTMLDY